MHAERPAPGIVFRLTTGLLAAALALALAFGVLHESSTPAVLGRYSLGYALLLLGIAVAVGLLGWLLLRPRPAAVRWAGNIYAMLISSAIVLGLTEVGLRVFNPWGIEMFSLMPYHMQGMVDHPQLGYAHPKSVVYQLGGKRVSLNSNGHRDDEMPVQKPAGERRILALGDSVTFGWGVDQGEDFPARLEALVRQQSDSAWQVINAGVNGYNSEQEAAYFAVEGILYQPDIVLLVFVANDVEPAFKPNAVTWRRFPSWPESLPEFLNRARSLSYLYQATNLFRLMRQDPVGERPSAERSITGHAQWPNSLAALRSIAAQCHSRNIRFLVAALDSSDAEFERALRDEGIDAISLGSAWERAPAERRHVSRIDPHPSAEVHLEVARELLAEMQKRGWLPPG